MAWLAKRFGDVVGRLVVRRRHSGGARSPSRPRRDLLRRRGCLRDLRRESGDWDRDGSGISRVHRCPSRFTSASTWGWRADCPPRPRSGRGHCCWVGTGRAAPVAGQCNSTPFPRSSVKDSYSLTLHELNYLIFQSFDGIPWGNGPYFGNFTADYVQTACYVGVIALVLIVAAVAIRWRSGEVLAFGAVALSMALAAFATPLVSILNGLPLLGKVTWQSSLFPMDFALAVLAGVGMDVLVRSCFKRAVLSWVGGGFAVAALILVTIWAFGRGHLPPPRGSGPSQELHLAGSRNSRRRDSRRDSDRRAQARTSTPVTRSFFVGRRRPMGWAGAADLRDSVSCILGGQFVVVEPEPAARYASRGNA